MLIVSDVLNELSNESMTVGKHSPGEHSYGERAQKLKA